MSTFRKTVLTTAIIGAGLASTSGAAFASEGGHHHHDDHGSKSSSSKTVNNSCSPVVNQGVENGGAKQLGLIAGSQGAINGSILCDAVKDNLNGNLSGNSAVLNIGGETLIPSS